MVTSRPTLTGPKPRVVTWREVPEWQFNNKSILGGYRPETDYTGVFRSLTYMHNETCNIYTHMIPALLLLFAVPTFLKDLAEPQLLSVTNMDYAIFGGFFLSAEFCLVSSSLYHLMQSHSEMVEIFWHGMDLLGIVIVTVGTFYSGTYYIYFCERSMQRLHWAIILTAGTITGALISHPLLKTQPWRNFRIASFAIFGASALIPLVHGIERYGSDFMLRYAGLQWYLLELAVYGIGLLLYVFRVPERFRPGKYDIWGSSHQLFHVAIICAMWMHTVALRQGFEAAHNLNVCPYRGWS